MPAISILFLLLVLVLGGCSSGASVWSANFEPEPGVAAGLSREAPRVEPAVYAALENDPNLSGYEVVGASRVRSERLPTDWASEKSPLAAQARRVGASLVRAGERYAGNETRTKTVRVAGPSRPGAVGASGSTTAVPGDGVAAVEVEVAIFEYLAVFYRDAAPAEKP